LVQLKVFDQPLGDFYVLHDHSNGGIALYAQQGPHGTCSMIVVDGDALHSFTKWRKDRTANGTLAILRCVELLKFPGTKPVCALLVVEAMLLKVLISVMFDVDCCMFFLPALLTETNIPYLRAECANLVFIPTLSAIGHKTLT